MKVFSDLFSTRAFGRLSPRCPVLLAACAAQIALAALPSGAAERQVLHGTVPGVTAGLQPIGRLEATKRLNLAISLPWRDREALTNLLEQITDPTSPQYRHYLSTAQFTAMFGPTEQDYQALIDFAQANGLAVTTRHPNRMLLDVNASVADIEKALHITMHLYEHPTEARTFYAPDAEPWLDLSVPVFNISGLNDYILPHPKYIPMDINSLEREPHLGSGPAGTYLGYDFRNAYVPGTPLTGSGQVVGLFQFDGYYPSDIVAYEALAGLPNVPLQNVLLDGFNGVPVNPGAVGEVSLDIEMVISMAPGVSKVMVYEAGPNGLQDDILNRMVTDNEARQLSSSWGWSGGPSATTDQIFQEMIAQGQTFFNASGDSDAFPPGAVDDPNLPNAPSDNPFITQVGGTILSTTGPKGSWVSETVWNRYDGTNGASGGISSFYSIPVWQQGIDMTTNQGSFTKRNTPDVALTAENVWTIANQGQGSPVGGTSVAAPLWAGFTALMNEQAFANGDPAVGFLNPAIYAIGKGPYANYTNAFHDIVTGNNTNAVSTNLFFAVPGYDLCTGLGSPAGTNLINLLAPIASLTIDVATNYVVGGNGNGVIDFDECNDFFLVLTNIGLVGATNVHATISTTTPNVFIPQTTSDYPDIIPGIAATNLTAFKIGTTPAFVCGTPVILNVVIKSDNGIRAFRVSLPSGLTGSPVRFDNFFPAAIPDNSPLGTNSPILVSGLAGAVQKVSVMVFISHPSDSDLTLQLISPDNTSVTLSANHGAGGQNYGLACSPDTSRTTFDDDATNTIANGLPPYIGVFQPDQPLATFAGKSGTNANGIWQLHVIDNAAGFVGTLQCWSLAVASATCTDGGGQCPGVDLGIKMNAGPNPDVIGSNLVYNITVTNKGPGIARGVVVTHDLPGSVQFVTALSSQGTVSQGGGVVTATLGNLAVGATATITVTGVPTLAGTIYSSASVTSTDPELNPIDNSVTVQTIIVPPVADLAVGIAGVPNPTIVGGPLTYTVSVTNNGPAVATGVVVSNILPASVQIVSANYSQGSITVAGNVVIQNVGLLTQNAYATATINVSPQAYGNITATAQASAIQPDPYLANNIATVTTAVGQAADLALGLTASPNPVVLTSNLTYFITVTNLGPNAATNVILNQTLPVGVSVVSTVLSQGTSRLNAGTLLCNLGTIVPGTRATATVIVTTTKLGTLNSSATVTASQADPNPANNTASVSSQVAAPFISITPAGATLIAESFSPPDGSIDAGETVTIQFRLQNAGNVVNTNLVATLLATGGVTAPSSPQTYGLIKPIGVPGGVPVSRPFTFTASSAIGGSLVATLQLQDGPNALPPVSFTFALPTVAAFANTNIIYVPNVTNLLAFGSADPYPSTLSVSGLTGQVGRVTATLAGLTHSYVHDVNALLVGPTGVRVLLLSHAADQSAADDLDVTFDQAAAGPIPAVGGMSTGSWQPSVYPPNVAFSNPAPAGPYSVSLSDLNGINPNGQWSLFVLDDSAGDSGAISNGWSLALTSVTPVNQLADIGISETASPEPVLVGNNLTYTFVITNAGPSTATGVTFSNALPTTANLVSVTASQGNYTTNGGVLIGNLASLPAHAFVTLTLVMQPAASGLLTNTASVSAFETDIHTGDNQAQVVSTVNLPSADVALSVTAAPDPVIVGSNLNYSVTVTNSGPGNALNVVVTDPLPPGTVFVSGNASQGSIGVNGGTVVASLGTLAPGATAAVSINLAPLGPGMVNNSISVATASSDTNASNNSVTIAVTAMNPVPNILAAGASFISGNASPPNGAINPGETVTLSFILTNAGSLDTANLVATLLASGGVTAPSAPATYGVVQHAGPVVARPFTFTADPSAVGSITATLQLQDGANNLGMLAFTFNLPGNASFANTNAIIIPDYGAASPYPSTITVSGLTGYVGKATVTIQGLTHSFPNDVNILLASPNQRDVVVMSHTGSGYPVTNASLTFDDAAGVGLFNLSSINSGTFKPSHFGSVTFPAPAPVAPYGSTLSVLNSIDPNGTWTLYVLDDSIGDSGYISGGWSLNLTAINTVNPLADLGVGISSSAASISQGDTLTYTVGVTNLGPFAAPAVVLTDNLPQGFVVISSSASQGSISMAGGALVASLGTLAANNTATVSFTATPTFGGTFVNTASVSGGYEDLDPANDSAQITTTVISVVPPKLSVVMSNMIVNLTLSGEAGATYVIQASTNLSSWTPISTNTAAADGFINYTDTNSPSFNTRFYRAVRQ